MIGFDINAQRLQELSQGLDRTLETSGEELQAATLLQFSADPADLAAWWGPTTGPRYRALARGEGETTIRTEPWIARSRSHQTTYPDDLVDRSDLDRELRVLARRVVADVVAEGRTITKGAVTVRNTSFFTESHSRTLPAPTTTVDDVADAAVALLDTFELRRPTRLLGVRVDLAPPPDLT